MNILFLCLNFANAIEPIDDFPNVQVSLQRSTVTLEHTSYLKPEPFILAIPSLRVSKRLTYISERNALNLDLSADYLFVDRVDKDNNTFRYMAGVSDLFYLNRLFNIDYGYGYVYSKYQVSPTERKSLVDMYAHLELDINVNPYVSFDAGIKATLATGFYTTAGITFKN